MPLIMDEATMAVNVIEQAVKKDLTAAAVAVNAGDKKAALQAITDAGEKLLRTQFRLQQWRR